MFHDRTLAALARRMAAAPAPCGPAAPVPVSEMLRRIDAALAARPGCTLSSTRYQQEFDSNQSLA